MCECADVGMETHEHLFSPNRKTHRKFRSSRFGIDGYGAFVLLHDAHDHVQSQPRPLPDILGRKKGIEYPRPDVVRDART